MRSLLASLTLLTATLGCDGPGSDATPDEPDATSRDVQLGDGDALTVATYAGLVINEVAPGTSPGWFELYNDSAVDIDLAGVTFAAAADGPRASFPAGSTVPAGGFVVRLVDAAVGFVLAGDRALFLYAPDGHLIDTSDWSDGVGSGTWGRYPDGVEGFIALTAPTPGGPNSKARYDIDAPIVDDVETVDTTITPEATFEAFETGETGDTTPVVVDTTPEVGPSPTVVINELYYDEPSTDGMAVFTELAGPPGTDLTGWTLVGLDGNDGEPYREIDLSGAVIPGNGLLVIATEEALGSVASVRAFVANVDWQNGPDAVALIDPDGRTVDAVQYGSESGFHGGEGPNAPDVANGRSLSRRDRIDTNDNAADFESMAEPTPGR